jgi:hypothetical protein
MSQPIHKQLLVLAVTLFTSSTFVFSAPDTPEARRKEAERYLQVSPPKALFEDMADIMPVMQAEIMKAAARMNH